MKQYNKTFIGSIVVFFVGTSCCWLSALAIGLGGMTLIGGVIRFVESWQSQFISLSAVLLIISLYLYQRIKKEKLSNNKDD